MYCSSECLYSCALAVPFTTASNNIGIHSLSVHYYLFSVSHVIINVVYVHDFSEE